MRTLRRRRVEAGLYEVLDEAGVVVATIVEYGVRGYRWRVRPAGGSPSDGWDSQTLDGAVDDLRRAVR